MESLLNLNIYNKDICLNLHNFNEIVSNNIRQTRNFFEIEFLKYIKDNYPNQHGIIDIGANIGNHSLFFLEFLNCDNLYAFEPHPDNLSILKLNLSKYKNKSLIYDIALSNKDGLMPLYNSEINNYGGFSLFSYNDPTVGNTSFLVKPDITVKPLDSFNLTNISMIKIDVENYENEVLDGARNTIQLNRPIIFVENLYHGYPYIQPNPDIHLKILTELNYVKKDSNIKNSFMDLWIPAENVY